MCKCLRLYERGGELESSFSYWTPPVWTLSGQITECVSASLRLSLYSRLPCRGLTSGHASSGRSQRLMKTARMPRSSWPSASRPNHHTSSAIPQTSYRFSMQKKIHKSIKSMCIHTRHDDSANDYEDFFIRNLCMVYNFCLFFEFE